MPSPFEGQFKLFFSFDYSLQLYIQYMEYQFPKDCTLINYYTKDKIDAINQSASSWYFTAMYCCALSCHHKLFDIQGKANN